MATKQYPYIHKTTGEVKILPKSEGRQLSEDWARAKLAKNEKGERVFRFEIETPVIGRDGKTHMGVATVDISEVETPEAEDGDRDTK